MYHWLGEVQVLQAGEFSLKNTMFTSCMAIVCVCSSGRAWGSLAVSLSLETCIHRSLRELDMFKVYLVSCSVVYVPWSIFYHCLLVPVSYTHHFHVQHITDNVTIIARVIRPFSCFVGVYYVCSMAKRCTFAVRKSISQGPTAQGISIYLWCVYANTYLVLIFNALVHMY